MFPAPSFRSCTLLTCAFSFVLLVSNLIFDLPWLSNNEGVGKGSLISTQRRNNEKGMVMCVGNDAGLIAGALYTVKQLKDFWESSLPVSIVHCNELSITVQNRFTKYQDVIVKNMCNDKTTKKQKARLKGWFCKTNALVYSDYIETMVVDTDVLWFKNPSFLFDSPSYLSTGALFFRDRFLYETKTEKDGLEFHAVKKFIENETGNNRQINDIDVKRMFESNGVNFFWLHGVNDSQSAIRHVQESSVIILNKNRLPKTVEVLRRLYPTFNLGINRSVVL